MLELIDITQTDKWNETIKKIRKYDTYYLHEYAKAFQLHGDGEPLLIYYENQEIKAINVVMKRDISTDEKFEGNIPENTYFDISTPYGYGGFLIEGNITEENIQLLNEEYTRACVQKGIISEFVRFHPVSNNSKGLNELYDISTLGKTITIDLKNPEIIWGNLIPKNRNVIRKAKKNGIEIYWGRNVELFNQFVKMYNATMDKDNAADYYYFQNDFYESLLNDLKYNSMIFYAVYNDNIIAMSIILFTNEQMHYHLSASDKKYQHLAPSNLLLYEASCWGYSNGFKTFHLGGGLGSNEDSLYKFKKAFNRNSKTEFSIGRKIFSEKKYLEFVDLRKKQIKFKENNSFFPLYRN